MKERNEIHNLTHSKTFVNKNLFSSPSYSSIVIAKGDSGASCTYWRQQDIACLTNVKCFSGAPVTLLDNEKIKSNQQGLIPLHPKLSSAAKQATVLPKRQSAYVMTIVLLFLTRNNLW